MPDNSVKITLEAVDKTQAAFKQLESTSAGVVSNIGSQWAKFAAGAAAIYGVVKGVQSFLAAAGQAEQIESRMAFQIGAVGIEYAKVKGAIDAYSNSIADNTRFSDEAARQGIGQMMQYTDKLAVGLKGTKLAMDMATQTGMDFESTTRLIGMAMNGNVEMLGRWIPELRNLNAVLGENATQAEKSEYALRLLSEKFGGAAQKDLDTYVGKMAQFKNRVDEVREGLGRKMLDALDWMKKTPFWQDWWAGVDSLLGITKKKMADAVKPEDTGKTIADEQAQADAAKRGYEEITKYASAVYELNTSYKILGTTAQSILEGEVSKTLWAVEKIKAAWQAGKASYLDYINAMKKAIDVVKGAGEDPTKKRVDLMVESEKKIKEIKAAGYDNETTRRMINEEIDLWLQRKKIIEEPIRTAVDVGKFEEDLRGVVQYYNENVKGPIESSPIKIKVDMSEMNELRRQAGVPTEAQVDFTGTGSSKKPLSEKIKEIIDQFGGMDEALSGMGAMINFTEMTMQFQKLQKQLTQIQSIAPSLERLVVRGGGLLTPLDPSYAKQIRDAEESVMSQMGLMQMKMIMELFRAFGQGEGQTGISSVPKTGWYKLHKGEEVRSTNQISMGGIKMEVNINGGGDAGAIADGLIKALKYRLRGELKDLLQ